MLFVIRSLIFDIKLKIFHFSEKRGRAEEKTSPAALAVSAVRGLYTYGMEHWASSVWTLQRIITLTACVWLLAGCLYWLSGCLWWTPITQLHNCLQLLGSSIILCTIRTLSGRLYLYSTSHNTSGRYRWSLNGQDIHSVRVEE